MKTLLTDEQVKKRIGANLRRLRGERTLRDVADRCGTYPINIQRIEKAATMPSIAFAQRIAASFGIGIDDLLQNPKKRRN